MTTLLDKLGGREWLEFCGVDGVYSPYWREVSLMYKSRIVRIVWVEVTGMFICDDYSRRGRNSGRTLCSLPELLSWINSALGLDLDPFNARI
jgi:hypothetical protein